MFWFQREARKEKKKKTGVLNYKLLNKLKVSKEGSSHADRANMVEEEIEDLIAMVFRGMRTL